MLQSKRGRWLTGLAVAVMGVGVGLALTRVTAGDPKARSDDQKQAGEAAGAVANLHMAHQLIDFGRKQKSPEALILAAEILARTSVGEMKDKGKLENPVKDRKELKVVKTGDDPKALLNEAIDMADDKSAAAVKTLASAAEKRFGEKYRGSSQPVRGSGYLYPKEKITWERKFFADEEAWVDLRALDPVDFDLYVYDESGREVARDTRTDHDAFVRWVPDRTQLYRITVLNFSSTESGSFRLTSN